MATQVGTVLSYRLVKVGHLEDADLGQIVDFLNDGLNEDVSKSSETSHIQNKVQEKFLPELSSVSSNNDVTEVMMSIVSEKTGYPQEMLNLSMDMESDLGIDSIKRVEILGSIQDKIPELLEIPADELGEMRTLGQIVDFLRDGLNEDVSELKVTPHIQNKVQEKFIS